MLNSVLWSKNIINRTKLLIYKPILESIVLYGSEVWAMNQQHANRLTAVEMDFWRRAARKSRMERIRNMEIRRMMHAERTIMDEIEHTCKTERRNRKGRPRATWNYNIQQSIWKFGVTDKNTDDREREKKERVRKREIKKERERERERKREREREKKRERKRGR